MHTENTFIFSKQFLLIVLGAFFLIVLSILEIFEIIKLPIYVILLLFIAFFLFFLIAILKYNFFNKTTIALHKIVDSVSDNYIILNHDLIISDFNRTLLNTFSINASDIINVNIIDLLSSKIKLNLDIEDLIANINRTKIDNSTIVMEQHFKKIDKYFHIEISNLKNNGIQLGTLIILKDITQHTKDMQTIRNNQDILIEKERLASLGQMIGGIAHNLKTPIMSISGAAEGLADLTNEYRKSIGDPEITIEDHHAIANDMDEWITKIRTHLSYMSDVITAVKGQAVAFSDNMTNEFTLGELVKYVNILMKHELENALVTLKVKMNLSEYTKISGNINSLVQVINNIISNAIQAYNGSPNEIINLIMSEKRK